MAIVISLLSKTGPKKLKGVALLRLDFNTEDDWRIKASLPTVHYLIKTAKAVVILSHKGRPLGFQKKFSLKKDAENLSELLQNDVRFLNTFNFW